MNRHQVLTGACNPGDQCYAVGSVEGIHFTVKICKHQEEILITITYIYQSPDNKQLFKLKVDYLHMSLMSINNVCTYAVATNFHQQATCSIFVYPPPLKKKKIKNVLCLFVYFILSNELQQPCYLGPGIPQQIG